ncbi:MAG: hypothetical protein N5P05_004499 (plasmid) [Chroococcopsis gigantea SAG 12.99]|jgi:hypothetical protein|nr:hypothetical protein [Chroococcopsis gigantea SAG 12.99]
MTTIDNGDAVHASNSAHQLESESMRIMLASLKGLVLVLSEMVREMRESRQQKESGQALPQNISTASAVNPVTPATVVEKSEATANSPTGPTVIEESTLTSAVISTPSTYIEAPAAATVETTESKNGSVVLPNGVGINGFVGVNKTNTFTIPEPNTQEKAPPQQIAALYAIKQTLTDPARVPDEGVRRKFSGLDKLVEGVKEIANLIATTISRGIERLKDKFNSPSLADELKRQAVVTTFANRLLDSAGHRGEDGKTSVQGANYRFERDSAGGISITDTSKGQRGQLFSLKDGVLHDKLQPKDLNNFLKAAEVLKSQQQTQGAER